MANYLIALRYSEPLLPGLEQKYENEILGPEEPPAGDASVTGHRYFEPIIKLVGEARKKIEKSRDYEEQKRMTYTDVIYIKKHKNRAQLEKEYRKQLEESLLLNDVIMIEPRSVCNFVTKTIRFGMFFNLVCIGMSSAAIFFGKFYRHKTNLAFTLFVCGSLLTILYGNSYESWPIADFQMLPDPLLCGVYFSPAVIFRTEDPIAISRLFDRYDRINFLYLLSVTAGLQLLYRIYQGPPPYLCPCTSKRFPEFPRYAFLLIPIMLHFGPSAKILVNNSYSKIKNKWIKL